MKSVCLSKGHGFTNFTTTLSIFRSVNVNCKTGPFDTDQYLYLDNPAYVVEDSIGSWAGRCIGFKNVDKTINCTQGRNGAIRRLCPCKGISNVAILCRSTYIFSQNFTIFYFELSFA